MTHLLLSTFITSSLDTRLSSPGLVVIIALSPRARTALELDTTPLPLVVATTRTRTAGGAGCSYPTTHGMDAFHAGMNGQIERSLVSDTGPW